MAVSDPTGEDFLDFLPLFPEETEENILARWRAWANEGLDPAVNPDVWVDTREGAHWFVCTMPGIREFARLYDLMGTEVPASGMILWTWGTYLDDQAAVWDVERKQATYAVGYETFVGPVGTPIAAGTQVSTVPATETDPAVVFVVTEGGVIGEPVPATPATPATPASPANSVTLPTQAVEAGAAGNVAVGAITAPVTPLPGVTLYNYVPTQGGADVETDEALRERVLARFGGQANGNVESYELWAAAWAGVGRVTVVPLWNGPNTVLVIVTDVNGQPLPAVTVQALQDDLDPVAGKGEGTAPVGHIVTVVTATQVLMNIVADVRLEEGYSLDGFGATINLTPAIQQALSSYVMRVASGNEIVWEQLKGRIVTIPGVHDVTDLTVNGTRANVALSANPAQAAALGALTLNRV